MRKTDGDPLGPGFDWRLRAALDKVEPLFSAPRYQTAPRFNVWRLAPAGVAVASMLLLALTAAAATGSADPTVWTQRATTTIQSVGHPPEPSPSPESSPAQPQTPPRAAPIAPPARSTARPATATPQGSHESPEPSENHSPFPQPTDHHPQGSPSPYPSPRPSPPPGE
jgi:hypothetical protein